MYLSAWDRDAVQMVWRARHLDPQDAAGKISPDSAAVADASVARVVGRRQRDVGRPDLRDAKLRECYWEVDRDCLWVADVLRQADG